MESRLQQSNLQHNNACLSTLRNWERLGVDNFSLRLQKRANKTFSKKSIIPYELLSNQSNADAIYKFVQKIKDTNSSIKTIINSLCFGLLKHKINLEAKIKAQPFFAELLSDYDENISNIILPTEENDLLGLIYQMLFFEGQKNKLGSYYTPQYIIDGLFSNIKISDKTTFLDPCCGSGRFLLKFETTNPENVYGFDIDENAVKIAKTNLIIKYANIDFMPNIHCVDFLKIGADLFLSNLFSDLRVDYIFTNPPWGTKYDEDYSTIFTQICSKELFSFFIVKSTQFIKQSGHMGFVLPEAFMNVKIHKDIRSFMLKHLEISEITDCGSCFSGVISKVLTIGFNAKIQNEPNIRAVKDGETYFIKRENFVVDKDNTFSIAKNDEQELIKKIYNQPYQTLSNSVWGLGVVTGDNANKLFDVQKNDSVPILTGKDIKKIKVKEATRYFVFDKKKLQQAASEEIYKAKEKLIYKFISYNLVFAYDDKQSFTLNSANLLIPKIDGMSAKTVCAFLNSHVMQFVHKKLFNQIKILKGDLCKLPFPEIDEDTNKQFSKYIDSYIGGTDTSSKINKLVYKSYSLTEEEISLIESSIR